jgi:antitoxin (DNA-binding transcriptional repressor) of toxin-antitoxin stability system
MKTATVADLRNNFRRVSSWIEHGETVQIMKRGRAIACLTGVGAMASQQPTPKPDIMAQLDEVWGDRVLSVEEVQAMREAELAEDHG